MLRFILIAVLAAFYSCSPVQKSPEQIAANKSFQSAAAKEKQVKEAFITDADVLHVTVKNDGSRRDGYAEYLCQLGNDFPENTVFMVRVVQIGTTNAPNKDTAYGITLGESVCN